MKDIFIFTLLAVFPSLKGLARLKGDGPKAITPAVVYYTSDSLKLKGYLYKPQGKGPFPVFMWNHDWELNPDSSQILATYWVKHGFIFFKPIRRGQGGNPGEYIINEEKQIRRLRAMEQIIFRRIYALNKKANGDAIAALQWIKKQPYVDTNNIVVAGYGYGGTQVLLTAKKDGNSSLGIKCFFAMSPALRGWYSMWGDSLAPSVERAKRPIFIWQARSDGNLGPITMLGPVLEKKGFPNRSKTYQDSQPPPESINVLYNYTHPNAWGEDVLKFLKDCGVKVRK